MMKIPVDHSVLLKLILSVIVHWSQHDLGRGLLETTVDLHESRIALHRNPETDSSFSKPSVTRGAQERTKWCCLQQQNPTY